MKNNYAVVDLRVISCIIRDVRTALMDGDLTGVEDGIVRIENEVCAPKVNNECPARGGC